MCSVSPTSFSSVVERVVAEHADLTFEHFHVDDAARRLIRFPRRWMSS